jgi:2-dehydro-3-deoxyphosphooctonate aldolase (KDO 8-P synthase)
MIDYNLLKNNFFIIAGPCVIERREICFEVAETLKDICKKIKVPYIFKSSFDKANRTSIKSFRGLGLEKGLEILSDIKDKLKIPVTTDVHESFQVKEVAEVVDIVQIPAFLCRQTDLLVEAGKSNKIVNIKKAQFLSGYDMKNVIEKVESCSNNKIILTERGNIFGYNNLIVDMRNILIMKQFKYPVVFDATHSVQSPGGLGVCSGGDREFAIPLAKAAVAIGANGIFMEVHPNPEKALCDGANSLYLKNMEKYIETLLSIRSKSL